jgi:hypothetical protein
VNDRRVHGHTDDGGEIVRYDRAGKWYVEYPRARMIPCRRTTLGEAAFLATRDGADAIRGLPGGRAFDAACQRAVRERW